jgi:hypothetical protein
MQAVAALSFWIFHLGSADMTDVQKKLRRASFEVRTREDAVRHLWRTDATNGQLAPYLHCILDAARDPRIYPRLRGFAPTAEIASLYQGTAGTKMAAVAPYLVCLGSDTNIFDWIWEGGWGQSWGIFFWSLYTFEGLRAHFRTLTKVMLPDGKAVLFRFYDPRVLGTFLPTCDQKQLTDIFGNVERFCLESPATRGVEEFSFGVDHRDERRAGEIAFANDAG